MDTWAIYIWSLSFRYNVTAVNLKPTLLLQAFCRCLVVTDVLVYNNSWLKKTFAWLMFVFTPQPYVQLALQYYLQYLWLKKHIATGVNTLLPLLLRRKYMHILTLRRVQTLDIILGFLASRFPHCFVRSTRSRKAISCS